MNNTEPSLESMAVVPPETPECDAFECVNGIRYVFQPRAGMPDWPAKARQLEARAIAAERERDEARKLLNSPELLSFRDGVVLEAAHQRQRWPAEDDAGKKPADWFWLVGYLAGKALHAQANGNTEKALHHTISTAAALANWHESILEKTDMRPGLPKEKQHE